MKKSLILFSLLLSLGALAEVPAEVPAEPEENFVIKGLSNIHKKCATLQAKAAAANEAQQKWAEMKQDCKSLPVIPEVKAHNFVDPADTAAPVAPAADLPKDEI